MTHADAGIAALIDQLAATPAALAHLAAEASDDALDRAFPSEWPARTTLAHFRDTEALEFRTAIERMLAEPEPEIFFFAAGDWERDRNRTRDRKEHLLADFALQRQATLNLLRMARPQDLARRGRRGERTFTVADMAATLLRHDQGHVAQLEAALGETLAQVRARRAGMA